jgi:hypothetical protein
VVSDDDSVDDTVATIERAVHNANAPVRLKVLRHRPPLGVARNSDAVMLAITGDVVFLSDQDDVWEDTTVAVLLEALEDPAVPLVASDAALIGGGGALLGESLLGTLDATATERMAPTGAYGWSALLWRNLVTGATGAVSRPVFDRAMPFPLAWAYDERLAVVAAPVGTVALGERPMIRYRIHEAKVVRMRRRTARVMWSRHTAPGVERTARSLRRGGQLAERLDAFSAVVPDALPDEARQTRARAFTLGAAKECKAQEDRVRRSRWRGRQLLSVQRGSAGQPPGPGAVAWRRERKHVPCGWPAPESDG